MRTRFHWEHPARLAAGHGLAEATALSRRIEEGGTAPKSSGPSSRGFAEAAFLDVAEQGESFGRQLKARANAVETPFPLAFSGQFDLLALAQEAGFDATLPGEGRLLLSISWSNRRNSLPRLPSAGD